MRLIVISLLAFACFCVSLPALAAHAPVTVTMKALNGSNENGTATLSDLNGKTKVVIHLMNEPMNGNQPVHIHPGTCAKLNPVPKYILKNIVGGTSTTVVDVTLTSLLGGKFAINAHESPKNLQKYVSCGNIP